MILLPTWAAVGVTMQAWVSLLTPLMPVVSLVVAIVACTIAVKSYKKSKRLEFFQRRDQVFLAISDLNAKTAETHLISARLGIVILSWQARTMPEQYRERQKAQIVAMEKLREEIDLEATHWGERIKELHSIGSRFTFGMKDSTIMEDLKDLVLVASDNSKRAHEVRVSTLHTLESIDTMMATLSADMRNLEAQRAQLESEMRDIPNSEKASE
jgi:hypothetical protein